MSTNRHLRNRRQTNWYWVDNDVLDRYAKLIKDDGVAVYSALARSVFKNTGVARVSYDLIEIRSGVCRRKLRKVLDRLAAHGLIEIRQRYGSQGRAVTDYVLVELAPSDDATTVDGRIAPPSPRAVEADLHAFESELRGFPETCPECSTRLVHTMHVMAKNGWEVHAHDASGTCTWCMGFMHMMHVMRNRSKTKIYNESSSPTPSSTETPPPSDDDDDVNTSILSEYARITGNAWNVRDRSWAEALAADYSLEVISEGIRLAVERCPTRVCSLRYCVGPIEEVSAAAESAALTRTGRRQDAGAPPDAPEGHEAPPDATTGQETREPIPAHPNLIRGRARALVEAGWRDPGELGRSLEEFLAGRNEVAPAPETIGTAVDEALRSVGAIDAADVVEEPAVVELGPERRDPPRPPLAGERSREPDERPNEADNLEPMLPRPPADRFDRWLGRLGFEVHALGPPDCPVALDVGGVPTSHLVPHDPTPGGKSL